MKSTTKENIKFMTKFVMKKLLGVILVVVGILMAILWCKKHWIGGNMETFIGYVWAYGGYLIGAGLTLYGFQLFFHELIKYLHQKFSKRK